MNVINKIKEAVNLIAKEKFAVFLDQAQLSVEFPKNSDYGDLATNAAMLVAKICKENPLNIAEIFKQSLLELKFVTKVNIVKPGFINFNIDPEVWWTTLKDILEMGEAYGDCNLGAGENVNIEFLSTNPTGPMHIGHSRCGIYGDALAKLLEKTGYKITKEYYINDAGSQITVLANSTYLRYLEASGEHIGQIPEGLYPGDYLIPVGQELFKEYNYSLKTMPEIDRLNIIKKFAIEKMMELIKHDLRSLGIEYDVFFSEKTLHEQNKITEIVDLLKQRGVVYKGVLPPPKGKVNEEWEEREQLLIRSSDLGDDVDRSLQKSNGEWTYAAADIAYMQNKIERGFKKITMVLGADHMGYKKRMQAIVNALAGDKVEFEIKFCQIVNFLKNGQPFKMSKRKGTFLTIDDVLNEVDKDIVRFVMLTRRNDQVLDFDFEKVKEQSKDNPVFYVQYANARINSTLNNACTEFPNLISRMEAEEYDLSLLDSSEDISLIKLMASWPKAVEAAALHQEPHRIAFYLMDLAAEFHSFWAKGNENKNLRFIIHDNQDKTLARLILAKSVKIVISAGLKIINILPIEKM